MTNIPDGTLLLKTLNNKEVSPGVFIIGEPTPIEGSDKLRALADVNGALCVVELKIVFGITKHD